MLTRDDLRRLLRACRGHRWDAGTQSMVAPAPSLASRQLKIWRRHIARLLILAAYTGSRCSCLCNLKWEGDEDSKSQSYIDVQHQPALLYRLGPDITPGKLSGVPVYLGRRISNHLRIWNGADAKVGRKWIATPHFGTFAKIGVPFPTIRKIFDDAGLPSYMTFDDIRYSVCYYLARSDIHIFSSSILLGMNGSDFDERFQHLRPDYQKDVVEGLTGGRRSMDRC